MVRYLDATRTLSPGVVVYPGDPVPTVAKRARDGFLISDLTMGSHTGTHIDAPDHYLFDGRTVDRLPLDSADRPVPGDRDHSDRDRSGGVEGQLQGASRVLLKTWFSRRTKFVAPFPALTPAGAAYLIGQGVRLVGTDAPSIEAEGSDGTVHRTLLGPGGAVIELLDLANVPPGDYGLIALPLRLQGGDGAPARVVLEVRP